jgi:hypothetical protein
LFVIRVLRVFEQGCRTSGGPDAAGVKVAYFGTDKAREQLLLPRHVTVEEEAVLIQHFVHTGEWIGGGAGREEAMDCLLGSCAGVHEAGKVETVAP